MHVHFIYFLFFGKLKNTKSQQNGQHLKARFFNQLLNVAHFDRTFDWENKKLNWL